MNQTTTRPLAAPALMAAACIAGALGATPTAQAAAACAAQSGPQPVAVVELYTSEGCNSCPPADRWLSSLKGRPGVVAAAFHVDYWDRLGWTDRFGSPRHTARQAEQQPFSGARFSYTPQVTVNGRDWRGWPVLPAASAAAAPVRITAERLDGQTVQVQVQALAQAGAPARFGLWWALTEDGHQSAVRAGENQGVTLRHDHVVRFYQREPDGVAPAPAVNAATGAAPGAAAASRTWRLAAPALGEGGRPSRLVLVVIDAATRLPVQALALDC